MHNELKVNECQNVNGILAMKKFTSSTRTLISVKLYITFENILLSAFVTTNTQKCNNTTHTRKSS